MFREKFIKDIKNALDKAEGLKGLDHQGMKGTLREILVSDMLGPVLPPEVKVATGKLVSAEGAMSLQQDIILYSPSILPPALYDTTNGFVPVEAALYTIEIKSQLTATGVKEAIANARSTRGLKLLPTDHWYMHGSNDRPLRNYPTTTPYPVRALFAFGSDITSSDLDRYRRYDENSETVPGLQAICVHGKGYWYSRRESAWNFVSPSGDVDEIMSFLAGITNTLPQLLAYKGRPKFGHYLSPSGASHTTV